ncbi:MAG: hypothetical protein QOC66_617 [Pseudonocardiales bacterium]|nr:hypothetical protein [Pseudonocardiales bacterium]
MSAVLAAETALRPNSDGPVDYDASEHVVIAACRAVGRRPPRTARGNAAVFAAVHWGYGSAVALAYEPLRRVARSDAVAGAVFYAGCQAMALSLFPTLGGTPPPWRWKREVLLSSFTVHALYVATVVVVSRGGRRVS